MSKKLICFSLWGNLDFYNYGALENAILAKDIYPGWICRFYYDESANPKIIALLGELDNVELVKMEMNTGFVKTMWRFIPAFHESDVIMISRDTDSRINLREKAAVREWLESDKDFHIMRDHSNHKPLILAGMWGCRNNILKPYINLFNEYYGYNKYTNNICIDQNFLKLLYNEIAGKALIHASYNKYEVYVKDFSVDRSEINNEFVGNYVRTAPIACNLMGEIDINRVLDVKYPWQSESYV